jgi:hypothetical protein
MDLKLVLALGLINSSCLDVPCRTLLESYLVDLLVEGLELMHQGVSLNRMLCLHSCFHNRIISLRVCSQRIGFSHNLLVFSGHLLSLRGLDLLKALSKYTVFLFQRHDLLMENFHGACDGGRLACRLRAARGRTRVLFND